MQAAGSRQEKACWFMLQHAPRTYAKAAAPWLATSERACILLPSATTCWGPAVPPSSSASPQPACNERGSAHSHLPVFKIEELRGALAMEPLRTCCRGLKPVLDALLLSSCSAGSLPLASSWTKLATSSSTLPIVSSALRPSSTSASSSSSTAPNCSSKSAPPDSSRSNTSAMIFKERHIKRGGAFFTPSLRGSMTGGGRSTGSQHGSRVQVHFTQSQAHGETDPVCRLARGNPDIKLAICKMEAEPAAEPAAVEAAACADEGQAGGCSHAMPPDSTQQEVSGGAAAAVEAAWGFSSGGLGVIAPATGPTLRSMRPAPPEADLAPAGEFPVDPASSTGHVPPAPIRSNSQLPSAPVNSNSQQPPAPVSSADQGPPVPASSSGGQALSAPTSSTGHEPSPAPTSSKSQQSSPVPPPALGQEPPAPESSRGQQPPAPEHSNSQKPAAPSSSGGQQQPAPASSEGQLPPAPESSSAGQGPPVRASSEGRSVGPVSSGQPPPAPESSTGQQQPPISNSSCQLPPAPAGSNSQLRAAPLLTAPVGSSGQPQLPVAASSTGQPPAAPTPVSASQPLQQRLQACEQLWPPRLVTDPDAVPCPADLQVGAHTGTSMANTSQ